MTRSTIRREMKRLANPRRAAAVSRFFKTAPGQYGAGDRFLGLTVPALRTLAAKYRDVSLRDLSSLLSSPWHEERLLALLILVRQYAGGSAAERGKIYQLYLRHTSRINNWDLVDSSAEHIVGAHVRGGNTIRTLIHKAVGWMLREVGKRSRSTEEAFLRKHAARMPPTMLRYAIERFPERLRRRYLPRSG